MISLGIIFFLCLLFSGFFSGSEMAFVSTNKLKLRELSDSGDPSAKILLRLYESPHQFLTAILIGNNLVNVAATSIFTFEMQKLFGLHSEWLVTILLSPLILIFGEMVPKDYCRLRSQTFMLSYSGILWHFYTLFKLPTTIITRVIDFFLKGLKAGEQKGIMVSEKEFRSLVDESAKSGVVTRPEKRIIDRILDFEKIHVESVMVPLSEVPQLSLTGTVGEAKELARQSKSKFILVYEEIPSIVVGMVYVFDLLFEENENQKLKDYLRSPIFVPATTSIENAFLRLQDRHQSFAVVIDQSYEVVGVVPIEKLLVV